MHPSQPGEFRDVIPHVHGGARREHVHATPLVAQWRSDRGINAHSELNYLGESILTIKARRARSLPKIPTFRFVRLDCVLRDWWANIEGEEQ